RVQRGNHIFSRCQIIDAAIDCVWGGSEPITQKQVQRFRIDVEFSETGRLYGTYLGTEPKRTLAHLVINRFDTKRVARENETFPANVPDRQPKHAIEAVENAQAPPLVSMNDYFGVGLCSEGVPIAFQFFLQFWKIVNLAVKRHPNGSFWITHRLVSAGKINDRQTSKAQT